MQCVAVSTHNPPGTSGGGGGGGTSDAGGGGSDRTAVTYEVDPVNGGFRVLTETVDGIPWTLGYDVSGRIETRDWVAGGLEAVILYDSEGFGYGDDTTNIFLRGGAIQTFSAQMSALRAALITLGTPVSATFYVADLNNGLELEWNDVGGNFRGIGGTSFKAAQLGAYASAVNPGTTELTAYTGVVPEWLRADASRINVYVFSDYIGEADAKTTRIKVNGTTLTSGAVTATQNAMERMLGIAIPTEGSLRTVTTFTGYSTTASSASATATAIATGTDLTFTVTMQFDAGGVGGSQSTGHNFYVEVHNP